MLSKYDNENIKLLFTDTDSLTYEVKTNDIYDDMEASLDLFDTSEYSTNHKLYSAKNKKKLGKMKDETFGTPIEEFVGLRAKMYSLITRKIHKKTAKGVAKYVVKRNFKHDHYKNCLFNEEITRASMNRIQSFNHQLFSVRINKIALSPYDDKRYILKLKFPVKYYLTEEKNISPPARSVYRYHKSFKIIYTPYLRV